MAVIAATVQTLVSAGITPSFGAANADGYAIPGDGKTVMECKNTGSILTAVIDNPLLNDSLAYADKTVSIPATTGDKIAGPFQPGIYNQPSGTWAGYVLVTFPGGVSGLTVAFFRML